MSSRARAFAAVTLLIGCLAGPAAWGQAQNLEAGKSPSQLFAGACNACHKSPRGLLKTVSSSSLSGFLKEHYTTSDEMASQLAAYLISNGASDSRQAKQGADKQGQGGSEQPDHQGRKNRNAPSQEAARPDDTPPPAEGGRQSRKRQARPSAPPEEGSSVANAPAQVDPERGPDSHRLSARQRKKFGKPPGAEEPSMANEPANAEPPKAASGMDDKANVEPRQEIGNAAPKPDAETKPGEVAKSEPAKSETVKTEPPADGISGDKPAGGPDPLPSVTAAPAAAVSAPAPVQAPAIATEAASEPAASRSLAPATAEPQAVSVSAPPPRPAGPPAPPISQ